MAKYKDRKSECCDICGPNDCRTIEIENKTYEKIPADLIIKAGLAAASELITGKNTGSCCSNDLDKDENCGCCR